MKNRLKKVLKVMLLTLTIVLMYSISVPAATSARASIGGKNYATVQQALNAVKNGQTIKLKQDLTLRRPLVFKNNATYTFDMNKHKITSKITTKETGDLDIKAGKVTLANGTLNGAVFNRKGASLTVNSGTYMQITNWGRTVVNNGTVINNKNSAFCNYGGTLVIKKVTAKANYNCVYAEAGTVTVNGGNYRTANSESTYPLIYSEKATVYLKGGNYTATNGAAVYNEKGKITISGGHYSGSSGIVRGFIINMNSMSIKNGTFTSSSTAALFCGENSTTVINGGKFTLKNNAIDVSYGRKKLLINGGTFQAIVAVFCEWNDENITMDRSKVKLVGSTGAIAIH